MKKPKGIVQIVLFIIGMAFTWPFHLLAWSVLMIIRKHDAHEKLWGIVLAALPVVVGPALVYGWMWILGACIVSLL